MTLKKCDYCPQSKPDIGSDSNFTKFIDALKQTEFISTNEQSIIPDLLQYALVLSHNMNALKISLFNILLLAILLKAHGRRNFEIRLDSCNCTSSSIFAGSCDCHIDKTFDPPKGFFDLQMRNEVIKANFSFEVFALRKDSPYLLFSSTGMDFCIFVNAKAKLLLPMVKIFKETLLKFGKLPEKCPIEKDFHFLFQDVLLDAEQFPPYVPETRLLSTFNVTMQNYVLLRFEAYGDVVQKSKQRWG